MKVKCARLPSESDGTKLNESSANVGMKLTIKTTLRGCRKPSNNRGLSLDINKKRSGRTVTSVKQQKK